MKSKSLRIIIVLVFFSKLASSQTKFENGFVTLNNGEILKGLIKNYGWKNNPREIEFKSFDSNETKIISINDLKDFAFESGLKYLKVDVKIDRSSSEVAKLSKERNPVFADETLLLKQLVTGYITLYQYEEKDLIRFFYQHGDMPITQLIYKKYKVNEIVATNLGFIQQLKNDFGNLGLEQKDFDACRYNVSDLSKLIVKINKVKNPNQDIQISGVVKNNYNLTIRPGIVANTISVTDGNTNFKDADFGSNVSYRLGVEIEAILPSNNNKWALVFEPTFVNLELNKSQSTTQVSGGEVTANFRYQAIELPIGLRHYFFLNEKGKLFVNAQYSFQLNLNSQLVYQRSNGSTLDQFDVKTTGNFILGTGYKYGTKLSAEVRYGFNKNFMKSYQNWDSNFTSFSFVLGYTIR